MPFDADGIILRLEAVVEDMRRAASVAELQADYVADSIIALQAEIDRLKKESRRRG